MAAVPGGAQALDSGRSPVAPHRAAAWPPRSPNIAYRHPKASDPGSSRHRGPYLDREPMESRYVPRIGCPMYGR